MKKVVGNCALCDKNGILINSHIIPDFSVKTHEDVVTISFNSLTVLEKQPVYREHMLCNSCEIKFGKKENIFKQTFNNIFPYYVSQNIPNGLVASYAINNIDEGSLNYFISSILFRVSMSKNNLSFKDSLNDSTITQIKKTLIAEDPSPQIEIKQIFHTVALSGTFNKKDLSTVAVIKFPLHGTKYNPAWVIVINNLTFLIEEKIKGGRTHPQIEILPNPIYGKKIYVSTVDHYELLKLLFDRNIPFDPVRLSLSFIIRQKRCLLCLETNIALNSNNCCHERYINKRSYFMFEESNGNIF